MLDIKFIREHEDEVRQNCLNRQARVDFAKLLELDKAKHALMLEIQTLREERNKKSKTKPTDEEIAKMKEVGDSIQTKEGEMKAIDDVMWPLLLAVPNMTHPDVKISDDENDNQVLEQFGQPTRFNFEPLDHVQLAENLDLLDLERGAKVAGTKFYYLKNELALLELALVNYAMDIIVKRGYIPLITPDLAKTDIVERMGFNPRGEATQVYQIQDSDLSLIGTAEITLGGYHADEALNAEDLPLRYVAMSHCFRTEAGSYSKFSKGLYRVHQFTKVEMFIYCSPEDSEKLHEEILEIEKDIWQGLDLPFRVIDHSSADLGNPSYRTFDLEVWLPGKPAQDDSLGDWAEVTSCSNCTDYQARGLNTKIKNADGTRNLAHTLNGTGIATSRALIAILENYQEANGTVKVPKVLQKYLNFKIIK
jgi:seryl-tRNA synthetase